ncbi:metallophosphoesterase family protein [Maritimibacter sp. HL-12]|uniref:metallophosphoesterase family protein n=1 Tax=Maritimibacter sp. HL-12 TaxID=1162418 RepID=UPI000A0EEEDE|nr:metallophosphoesterase family protein [Maritimibacter sp. HL-12]SMH46253.1 serine/threonine protein phosphatase 1 [Maritimibacter sp. HL-12]
MRTYAIGDIHGYLGELKRAHELVAQDRADTGDSSAPVIHIGDLCDRGPDTRGVIDFLLAGIKAAEPWVVLKGNHDRMMARFLEWPKRHDENLRSDLHWLHSRLGGSDALASYGVDITADADTIHREARDKVPDAHQAFLDSLPTSYRVGDLFFCHAGIRPGVPLDQQTEDDLCWIRDEFLTSRVDHGPLIVHGHTPVEVVEHHGNRVNIDTGAGYGRPLVPVVIEGRDVWALTEAGRVKVVPE